MIKLFNYKSDRLHGLDHLRAVAIILVIISQWTFWICILMAMIGGFVLYLFIERPSFKVRKILLS